MLITGVAWFSQIASLQLRSFTQYVPCHFRPDPAQPSSVCHFPLRTELLWQQWFQSAGNVFLCFWSWESSWNHACCDGKSVRRYQRASWNKDKQFGNCRIAGNGDVCDRQPTWVEQRGRQHPGAHVMDMIPLWPIEAYWRFLRHSSNITDKAKHGQHRIRFRRWFFRRTRNSKNG